MKCMACLFRIQEAIPGKTFYNADHDEDGYVSPTDFKNLFHSA